LLETIVNNTKVFEGNEADPLQLQVCQLAYDDYIGRLGIGRINERTNGGYSKSYFKEG
jgi:GTP-binding protein